MKKIVLIVNILVIGLTSKGQICYKDIADSTIIRYATFEELSTIGMTSDDFFNTYLHLEKPNRFVPSDTIYSPDSIYRHVKYKQYYSNYYVENSMLTLTFHQNNIIRYRGYYLHIETLEEEQYKIEDAINRYNNYYGISADSFAYQAELVITEDTFSFSKTTLSFKIQSSCPLVMNKILYVSAVDLSIVKEENASSSGFNATLYTRYNGIRYGNQFGSDSSFYLCDNDAAISLLKIDSGVTNLGAGVPNTFYNKTNEWNRYSDTTYPQHILDAYWAACQYSYYMQKHV